MNIVDPSVDSYLFSLTPEIHEVLRDMEAEARERNFPIIGPLVGRVLYQYAKLLRPKRILELGSGYGYSAMWWSLATSDGAQIICTEGSAENIKKAEHYLSRAGFWKKIRYIKGDAVQSIADLTGDFDIIFMDIDKHDYPRAFSAAFPMLRAGGLFITDNVLWSGRVTESNPDATTAAIQEYNHMIYNTPNAFSTILPLRDGVAVTYKQG